MEWTLHFGRSPFFVFKGQVSGEVWEAALEAKGTGVDSKVGTSLGSRVGTGAGVFKIYS